MRTSPTWLFLAWILSGLSVLSVVHPSSAQADAGKYALKSTNTPPPKELKEPIRMELGSTAVQWLDDKGAVVGTFWFRKALPVKATPAQVQNGLTYREVEEGTLLGAVRFDRLFTDYRKQKVPPGVYTLRLGFQPMDGDHMGTAQYPEFALLLPAAIDDKPGPVEVKQMREESAKTVKGSHPAVLMLFPNEKPEDAPKLVAKEGEHVVLTWKAPVTVEGQKASLGFALTVIGHTTAE